VRGHHLTNTPAYFGARLTSTRNRVGLWNYQRVLGLLGWRNLSAISHHIVFLEGNSSVRTGLTVIAYLTAKAGREDQVREALLDLVAQTRNEKGCVNYDLHQSRENPGDFAIYENWHEATDLHAHAKSAHVQAFNKIAGHLLERPAEIRKWSMISELGDADP